MSWSRRPRLRRRAQGERRAFSFLAVPAAALAVSVSIAACGGSSSPKGESGLPSRATMQADAVKFAKCMREHGIQAEVNTNGGAVQMRIGSPGAGHAGGPDAPGKPSPPPGMETAQQACKRYMPNEGKPPKLSPAEEAKMKEGALKFARCMRSHGVDIPDPGSSGAVELGSNVDPHSATFEDAQKACQGVMGKLPLRMMGRVGPGGGKFQSETAHVGG